MTPEEEQTSNAATKVQEAASKVARAASGGQAKRRGRITPGQSEAEAVTRAYFEAIGAHDVEGAAAMWADGGREDVRGQGLFLGPEGVREFIGGLIEAMPDLSIEIVSTTTENERCALQWRIRGTFAGPFNGIAPTGHRMELEGVDILTVRDGSIQANDAFTDTMSVPRQIGMMPPLHSSAEQRMMSAFNAKTKLTDGLAGAGEAKLVAEGVWVVQGQPGRCSVFFIENGSKEGGVTMFDAGARTMTRAVARAGAKLGGITKIVLGHGHTDHRGTAPGIEAPVWCHPDEVIDAEGSGGWRYWPADLAGLPPVSKQIQKALHRYAFDAGPVQIEGTVKEGDKVAGFQVIDLPGHAPGLIGLWRESDRLALVTDCFYTLDMFGRNCPPSVPVNTYNYDTEQARQSIRKLAEMEPAAAWPGHADPVTGDVKGQLLKAAEAAPVAPTETPASSV